MADSSSACILLAAGASRRFGSPKMSAKLHDGTPMLLATLVKYQAVFERVIVVVRPDIELYEQLNTRGAVLIHSPNADQGMSQSLIAGVQATKDSGAWLIALGDMPYVQTSTIQTLHDSVSADGICMPTYQGSSGNPVVFGKDYYAALTGISGDKGAKSVIQQYPDKLQKIAVDDQGVLQDIDTPEQLLV